MSTRDLIPGEPNPDSGRMDVPQKIMLALATTGIVVLTGAISCLLLMIK